MAREAPKATVPPVASGVCEAQVGAAFFVTVQLRVAELVPLLNVATRVLAPAENCDEKIFTSAPELPRGEPFTVQVTAHEASFGTTAN